MVVKSTRKETELKHYPIQARYINVVELQIRANRPPDISAGVESFEHKIGLGHGKYDEKDKSFPIFIRLEAGEKKKDSQSPYYLKLAMMGIFDVSDTFPKDRLEEWAKMNALFVFYPYLREAVFALTARCGFRPLILPLVEIPTFTISPIEEK